MVTFIVLAAVLTAAAVAVVALPLLRKGPVPSARWAALASVLILVAGGTALYNTWSTWSWDAPDANAQLPDDMVARLARRLEKNPDDLDGWLRLGRSYTVLEQFPLAAKAYQRADHLANGQNAEALIGFAESLALVNDKELEGRAGRAIEQALVLDPQSGKALFYGAAAALRRGELPLARSRFEALLALNPPENVRPVLREQIAAIDERLAATGGAAPTGAVSPVTPAPAAASNNAAVSVRVSLGPQVKINDVNNPLFVIVRAADQPGPPIAAKRLISEFPQTVELTPADAMIAGREFSAGQEVQVIARISLTGTPTAASGDPYGEARYRVGKDGLVNIVIDRVTP